MVNRCWYRVGEVEGEFAGETGEITVMAARFGASRARLTAAAALEGRRACAPDAGGVPTCGRLLIGAAPRVVPKGEIHQHLWPAGVVMDSTLVELVKRDSPRARRKRRGCDLARCIVWVMRSCARHRAAADFSRHWLVAADRRFALTPGENIIGRDPAVDCGSTIQRCHVATPA